MRNAGVRPGAACTSTWFARVLGLATALILAAGCTPPGVPRKASGSDVAVPSPADPEAQAMSEVLAGEIAGQSGDLEQAMVHYLRAAELSDDPQLAAKLQPGVTVEYWLIMGRPKIIRVRSTQS